MYTPDFCDELIEKLANMEMGMQPQQPPMSPGSGGLVPDGGGQDPNAAAGAPAAAGPKGPAKVKPEQLYERMLKMTGRMADMSAQLGQSGQPSQSMEQMVREDQQEMQAQSMGGGMDPSMGQDPSMMGQDPNAMGGMPPQGMDPMMGGQPGLQPQASLKLEIAKVLEKEALLGSALSAQFAGGLGLGAASGAGDLATRFRTYMKSGVPSVRGTANMLGNRARNRASVKAIGGGLEGSSRIGFPTR
jgi:hypothetical protein